MKNMAARSNLALLGSLTRQVYRKLIIGFEGRR